MMAGMVFVPACWPRKGGKMIFPAPKKSAKSMSPMAMNAFLLFMKFPRFCHFRVKSADKTIMKARQPDVNDRQKKKPA